MESTFKYDNSITQTNLYRDTIGYWNESMDMFDKGKYKESIVSFLKYMNSELVKSKGNNDMTEFNFPHGSMIINFKITPDFYEIRAPFLKIPEKRAVVLLRQISEINFSILGLSQIFCKNNELYFYYKAPLSNCYPHKLWDLFYEICINGDYYDDKYVSELEAERINKPDVTNFTKDELDKAYGLFTEIIDFGIKGCNYYRDKRWFSLGVDHGFITYMKLDHVISPQGILINNIKNYFFFNRNISEEENLNRIIENLNKLKNMDRKTFDDSMYKTTFLIPIRKYGELEYIQNLFKKVFEQTKTTMANSNFMSVTYTWTYKFYHLLYTSLIPFNIEKIIIDALKKAGEKKWEEAARILMSCVEQIMNLKGGKK